MKNFAWTFYTRLENQRIRKVEQKLLALEIAAFEEWQHRYPTFQTEPRILEKLTRALQDAR